MRPFGRMRVLLCQQQTVCQTSLCRWFYPTETPWLLTSCPIHVHYGAYSAVHLKIAGKKLAYGLDLVTVVVGWR